MKKSPLFLIFPLLTLGVLSFAYSLGSERNVIQEAKAVDPAELANGKYFITNNDSKGLYMDPEDSNYAAMQDYDKQEKPIFIEKKNGDYYIYQIYNSNKYYLSGKSNGYDTKMKFRLESDMTDRWYNYTIEISSGGKYRIKLNNTYYVSLATAYFKIQDSNPGFQFDIVSVESASSGVATKIEDISCDNGVTQPSKSEWDEIKDEYDLLSSPIKKYLKTVIYDKDDPYNNIETQLIKYDYILAKYKNEVVEDKPKYENYLDRTVLDMGDFDSYRIKHNETTYSDYIIAGVLCVATVIIGVTLLNIRRRKER